CAAACSRLHEHKNFRLERWGSYPGRTSRPACHFTTCSPFRTASQCGWPPLPVPASMLRVSLPYPSICTVRSPHHTKARHFVGREEANPVPTVGCYSKTEACEF